MTRSGPRRSRDVVRPFSYFLKQSDELGFMGTPKGVQITYDGAYNTKFGDFTLSAGTPLSVEQPPPHALGWPGAVIRVTRCCAMASVSRTVLCRCPRGTH